MQNGHDMIELDRVENAWRVSEKRWWFAWTVPFLRLWKIRGVTRQRLMNMVHLSHEPFSTFPR